MSSTTLASLEADGILYLNDGYRTRRDQLGEPAVPILRVAEVLDGRLEPSFADHVQEGLRPAFGRKTSLPGDVVVTTKGTVGRVAQISDNDPEFVYSPEMFGAGFPFETYSINEHVYSLRASSPLTQEYLHCWLSSGSAPRADEEGWDWCRYPGLNSTAVKHLPILIPLSRAIDQFRQVTEPIAKTRSPVPRRAIDSPECWTLCSLSSFQAHSGSSTLNMWWRENRCLGSLLSTLDTQRYFLSSARGEEGSLPATPPPELVSDEPGSDFAQMRTDMLAAFDQPGVIEQTDPALAVAFTNRLIHGCDLATATGQDATMPADLADAAYENIHGRFSEEQRQGTFKPERPVDADASPQARLLAYTGRDPN